ncbi:MAG TPA: hypothetical protein VHQ65_11030 [Thermoanaerobaculia bacterium]|nr:hypothetical protein [Thermoanaerobaculia bacterium]
MSRPMNLLGALALTFALGACRVPPEPAGLPAPHLDPTLAVLSAETPSPAAGETTADGRSSFAERLARRSGRTAAPASEPPQDAVARQTIPLGNGLVADLPRRFGDWQWSREGDLVLALHGRDGRGDALIWVQAQPAVPESGPALATNRFLYAVEPELASEWLLLTSELGPLAAQLATGLPVSPWQAAAALEALATPTAGRGLGYRSEPGSFTGWRWLGENPHGIYLRLGRTRGVWGAQREVPREVRALAESLSTRVPGLQELLGAGADPASGTMETPAWLLLGSASHGGRVLDLAILCRQAPDCAVEDDLAAFLTTLRPAGAGGAPALPGGSPADLARTAGLQFLEIEVPLAALAAEQASAAALRTPAEGDR